jgi:hypothetical protein
MLNIEIDHDRIRVGERFSVAFYRTLRVPDDGKAYPLPPGLGAFPLYRVEDYRDRVPPDVRRQGGVLIPLYQREAIWLGFQAAAWKPNAVTVAIGGINAVSGTQDNGQLSGDPQNYLVCPDQPWLDGIHTGPGTVRQFVAMPLGLGYTVEASLTGAEALGGIVLTVFEPVPGRFPDTAPPRSEQGPSRLFSPHKGGRMGLGAGGAIRQKIYPDVFGIDTWDANNAARVFVHLINSAQCRDITGVAPPPSPVDARTYTEHGLPWFEIYDEEKGALAPSGHFSDVKTIAARDEERREPKQNNGSLHIQDAQISKLEGGGQHRQTPKQGNT